MYLIHSLCFIGSNQAVSTTLLTVLEAASSPKRYHSSPYSTSTSPPTLGLQIETTPYQPASSLSISTRSIEEESVLYSDGPETSNADFDMSAVTPVAEEAMSAISTTPPQIISNQSQHGTKTQSSMGVLYGIVSNRSGSLLPRPGINGTASSTTSSRNKTASRSKRVSLTSVTPENSMLNQMVMTKYLVLGLSKKRKACTAKKQHSVW